MKRIMKNFKFKKFKTMFSSGGKLIIVNSWSKEFFRRSSFEHRPLKALSMR